MTTYYGEIDSFITFDSTYLSIITVFDYSIPNFGLPLAVDGVWEVKSTNSFIAVEIKDLVKCILVEFDGTRYINELVDIFEKD